MDVLSTAQQLVAIDSVTSDSNADVTQRLSEWLTRLHFSVRCEAYTDAHGTRKQLLAARRDPPAGRPQTSGQTSQGGIAFFCHSDVVSVDGWNCPHAGPFDGTIAHDRLWGRGACDMKGPIAAALAAVARIEPQQQTAPIYFFVTGDEECGMLGAQLLSQHSPEYAQLVAEGGVGIIGEPTSLQVVNAHKGGCHIDVLSSGVAAHSSTSEGRNANWQLIPLLSFLEQLHHRSQTEPQFLNQTFTPPTLSMNVVLENRPAAANITVGQAVCRVFLRPMPDTAWEQLAEQIVQRAEQLGLEVHMPPPLGPLVTPAASPLVQTALKLAEQSQPVAVSYATDGCCFPQLTELIVIGPGDIAQAHRPDEWIAVEQLRRAVDIYLRLFRHYAT